MGYLCPMFFSISAKDNNSRARAGVIRTSRGEIQTPIFMPVGTAATVKTVPQDALKNQIGAQIILANTYHLYLRPGTALLEKAGGVHRFMDWQGPMLTDSGGFQVFSLAAQRKIKEEGVMFRSHIDGSKHLFTPENVMDIQRSIGADIIMAFDECPPYPCEFAYARNSMELTHRWLKRCMGRFAETEHRYGHEQFLFPIVQGSTFAELRKQSAEFVAECDLPGNAIGGVSVGEPSELIYEITDQVTQILPEQKPRYLMGVGTPANILESIAMGVDMFDCVMPSRNGRHGLIFTEAGIINIKNERWKEDFTPIHEDENLFGGSIYTKAYLHHLFKSGEILGMHIATVQNLGFYLRLVKTAREKIISGEFAVWKKEMVEKVARRL